MSDEAKPSQGPESPPPEHPYFQEARRLMVQRQLRDRGIKDARVLDAMGRIPRQAFVVPSLQMSAYEDRPLEIGWGQTISQPYIVAYMAELLRIQPEDRVLDIGTGSGYGAAVLSLLAKHVYTVERNENLAHTAAFRLKSLGYNNVSAVIGDGTLGYPARAPYDAVVVAAAAPHLSDALRGQLALGGRLVCPVGPQESQTLMRITRTESGFQTEEGIRCVFVPLVGREGWPSI